MDRQEKIELFISELKKSTKLLPYQEDMICKALSNNTEKGILYISTGRCCGRRLLKNLYINAVAE